MATRETFTAEEWATIFQAPLSAGMAIVFTAHSGPLQAVIEVSAVAKAMASDDGQTSNGLIEALRAAVKNGEKPPKMETKPESVEQARSQALEQLQQAAALVDAKAPEDAAGFKSWLSGISVKVAEAAKEGSFLGIGGTHVTDDERAAVADVARALGTSPAQMDAPPPAKAPEAPDAPDFGGTVAT